MPPGRRWAGGQLDGHQGGRLPFSVVPREGQLPSESCLQPLVLGGLMFYMQQSLNSEAMKSLLLLLAATAAATAAPRAKPRLFGATS